MKRTEQIWINGTDNLRNLTRLSKNLYNEANYIIRQEMFNTNRWIRYNELNALLKSSENYSSLPAQTSQQILILLDKSWKSFFKAHKSWKKQPEKFKGRPKLPKYKNKEGEHVIVFTNQQCTIKNGNLRFPKLMDMNIKTRLTDDTNIREVRILPKGIGYEVEIVYEKELKRTENEKPDEDIKQQRIIGIDIGVRNLVTIGNNISEEGIAVRTGLLKSINQFYNKTNAELKSINDLQENKLNTKRMQRLFLKRNRKIKDVMHKTSRAIINHALSMGIDTIVIGHNKEWKQSSNMGRKNNQNFVQIPFNMLIQQIQYKAEEHNITVFIQDESYTSKCSFLDNESIEHHNIYAGKRVKRGIFRSNNGNLIHADLNASYNIIKKAIPEAYANGIEGMGLYPRSLNIPQFCGLISSKGEC